MFLVMTSLMRCREPLAIGEVKADASVKPSSESAQETSHVQAANPRAESTQAEADVATGGVVPPDAPPLVADLGPPTSGDGNEVMVEAFAAAPRPRAEVEGVAYLLPSSSMAEMAKDKAIAVVTTPLPGPRQSVLESTPPYSGLIPVRLDMSGHFPFSVLAEKRAKEQLSDITLLRLSVEYALADAAKEIAVLKRELDAAKGLTSSFTPSSAFMSWFFLCFFDLIPILLR